MLHELIHSDLRLLQHLQTGVGHFGQIVGRDVGGHTHGNTRTAVNQQVGHPGGQYFWHGQGVVVIIDEIHCVFIEICQQFRGHFSHAHFGVAHRGGRVSVNGSKITLTVYQKVAHREILSHAHYGLVDRAITMGVILTNDVTDHTSGLNIRTIMNVIQLVHGEQRAFMHGLKAVTHVRERTANDDAHSVI